MPRAKSATVDLKVRMKEPLRAKIEVAAKERGVSLNAETVARLEQTFQEEEALGGRQFRAMFSLFGNAAVLIEQQTGQSCFKDWNTWVAVQAAWKRLGVTFGPLPSKAWLKALLEASKATPVAFSEPPPEDAAFAGLEIVECPGPREEAGVIALRLRGALETPGRSAALVTRDSMIGTGLALAPDGARAGTPHPKKAAAQ